VIFRVDCLQVIDGDMGIKLGGFQGSMAQHLLQVPDRRPVPKHVRGAGVPESMRGDILFNAGFLNTVVHGPPDAVGVHAVAGVVQDQVALIFGSL